MTYRDREVQALLIELAAEETEDVAGAAAALISAGYTMLAVSIGDHRAAAALAGAVADARSVSQH